MLWEIFWPNKQREGDLTPLIEPDVFLANTAQQAIGNALAIYETERVDPIYQEHGSELPEHNRQELINWHIERAALADELEEALEIVRRYKANVIIPGVPSEDEYVKALTAAARMGYYGFWV